MKYSERVAVLNSEIPAGAWGRSLTSAECKRIRAQGYSCSERWIVSRAYDSPDNGILYYWYRPGGCWNHSGIYVKTR